MVIQTAVAAPGSYHTDAEINQVNKATGGGTDVEIGKVVFHDATDDNFKVAPTTGAGVAPFGVVVNKRPATTDTKMDVTLSGHVIVTSDGAIAPGNFVMASTTNAGNVIEYARTGGGAPTALQAADEFRKIIGRYIGKANGNERDGAAHTAAAATDKIWIKLGVGGGGF